MSVLGSHNFLAPSVFPYLWCLGFVFTLTSCSDGKFGSGLFKGDSKANVGGEPGKGSQSSPKPSGGDSPKGDEFEQAAGPQNVSGSYLVSAECGPEKALSVEEKKQPEKNVTILCVYLDENQKPVQGELENGKVKLTFDDGKNKTIPLNPKKSTKQDAVLRSYFKLKIRDFFRVTDLVHLKLEWKKTPQELIKFDSSKISTSAPFIAELGEGENSGNPPPTTVGPGPQSDDKIDALLSGEVYQFNGDTGYPDPFRGNMRSVLSSVPLGEVKLPPWQIDGKDPKDNLKVASPHPFLKSFPPQALDILSSRLVANLGVSDASLPPIEHFLYGSLIPDARSLKSFYIKFEGNLHFPKMGDYKLRADARTALKITISSSSQSSPTTLQVKPDDHVKGYFYAQSGEISIFVPKASKYRVIMEYVYSHDWNEKAKLKNSDKPLLQFKWKQPADDGKTQQAEGYQLIQPEQLTAQ